jgi:hypothetical protein
MAKDDYVDPVDVVFGALLVAAGGWLVSTSSHTGSTLGFGIAGLVLGALSAVLLRGRLALIAFAVLAIGLFYGIAEPDSRAGASYALGFVAGYGFVPRGFRDAKARAARARASERH